MTVTHIAKQHLDKTRALAGRLNAKATAGIAGASALVVAGTASASETSSAAQQAFDSLQSQATDMASSAWPVVTAIVGSLLAIGLFKKFANKST
ncbi:major coat protein [Modicisalibacter radicis]|uniref:major coat protein n=1 Tax=Halomonas sp. EAR18 TaxID=2518972 RepID=UPI00109D1BEF|nr:major coat protein [Halomonas sp. EAR18]